MTKKRTILLGWALALSVFCFGQQTDFQVLRQEKVVGKNLLNGSDIKGVTYQFTERIHEVYLDTASGYLTVQLRGVSRNGKWLKNKGNIQLYDLKRHQLKWSRKMAYQVSSLQQFGQTMIHTVGDKSYCLDPDTGKELWKVKNTIYFVDPVDPVGIGYRFPNANGYSNELEGIDLTNGAVIWKRSINREYGWNDVFYTNDSTLIVVAAGLHAVHLKKGSGWDYHTITGEKDYTGTVAANALGVAAGILTGTFVMSTGHNLVHDVVSNVLADSSHFYFASKEQLAKLDKETGAVIWNYPLPKDMPSKSSIFMDDSLVYLVNKGFAFMGNRQLDFGKPFIAAFDRETGKQKYLTVMDAEKDPILGFQILKDEIFLVFKNRMGRYSKETGQVIQTKGFPKENYGELRYFIGSHVYITTESGEFTSLPQSDTTKVFVFTSEGKALSIDNQLNVSDTLGYEDLNIYYMRTKDYKFFAKGEQTWIIDLQGQKVAEAAATSRAFLVGETLYDYQEDRFLAIDLKEVIKEAQNRESASVCEK